MVAGYWTNLDGLSLQYGPAKAIPEIGGDYLIYGETREVEQLIPLVPLTIGNAGVAVSAPPTSLTFATTPTTAASVGIQSLTTFMPLQLTTPQTASGSALSLTNPQLFIERVELVTLQTIAPTTNTMTIGLVYLNPGSPSSTWTQITPNAGAQLIGATTPLTLGATIAPVGTYTLFNIPTTTGTVFGGGVPTATTGNSGAWIGNVPLVTNTIAGSAQTIPQTAWISTLTSGAFTNGLLKLRIRYTIYGEINY